MSWFFTCLGFSTGLFALACWPLWRHPTLPRRKKALISLIIFLWVVVGGITLYANLGTPMMALL